MKKIEVAIVGGAGFTAGELIRILLNHPQVNIKSISSTSSAGKPLYDIHDDLFGQTELLFTENPVGDEDVVFLCLGHGHSKEFFDKNKISAHTKIIDLSNDFRLNENASFKEMSFVYGLPELQREDIKTAKYIANPGCFATAIQLAILPLAKSSLIEKDIHVSAITGSTGAGRSLSNTTHFSWRNNNMSVYKAFNHQHLGEIKQSIVQLQNNFDSEIFFIPYRGNFTRGIYASCYTKFKKSLDEAVSIYKEFYTEHPFVHVSDKEIHLKQVVGTNNVILHLQKEGDMLLINSVVDNLTKGASGQAIQNMNLTFGLPEKTGLCLRASQF